MTLLPLQKKSARDFYVLHGKSLTECIVRRETQLLARICLKHDFD